MKADYQPMEEGGSDDIKKSGGITINYDPSHKRKNLLGNIGNISSLMKSRISNEISPSAFIYPVLPNVTYYFVFHLLVFLYFDSP